MLLAAWLLAVVACASVPKESVALSESIGEDLLRLRESHIALVNVLYDRMDASVDRFVDDVYAPFTVEHTANDATLKPKLAEATAGLASADATTAKKSMEILTTYLGLVREDIEDYRALLRAP